MDGELCHQLPSLLAATDSFLSGEESGAYFLPLKLLVLRLQLRVLAMMYNAIWLIL